jgi:hypothetical protein
MDVLFFLKERTGFIRHYYETAAAPFCETICKIEALEAPFNNPPHGNEEEPPFLAEWIEADTGLEVLGRSCISMLSGSLQLYFRTWEDQLGVTWERGERKRAFEHGFLRGYRTCFGEILNLSWDDCPADFDFLEQVILARNRDQHPDSITKMSVNHSSEDRKKFARLFFISEADQKWYADPEWADLSWMNPRVHVSRDLLVKALDEVERLAEWFEKHVLAFRYGE